MKTWHMVLIAVVALGTLCCGGAGYFFMVGARKSLGDAKSAQEFARSAALDIGREWRIETVDRYSGAAFKRSQNREATRKYLNVFRDRLGSLTALDQGSMRNFRMESFTSDGSRTRAEFVFKGTFEKGVGAVDVSVIVREDGPELLGFNVRSDALLGL